MPPSAAPNSLPIPAPDPIPLPAPEWLLHALLILTFILHILPMNIAVGGGFLAGWTQWRAKRSQREDYARLARGLAQVIPYATAATISMGIAPLLFLQVLYGQFFYASSILMAVPWVSVIGMLVVGYYGFYRNSHLAHEGRPISLWIGWGSTFLFLVIGFFYTNNMTLMLTPEKWREAQEAHGFHLNLSDPSVLPRYLHFFVASIAVAGVLVVLYGLWMWRRQELYARWLVRSGSFLFIGATGVQFVVGVAFLFALPEARRNLFLGGDSYGTGLFMAGLAFAVAAMGCFFAAANSDAPKRLALAGTGSIVLTIIFMSLMRDLVRRVALQPHLVPFDVRTQWSPLILFGVLFVAGLATMGRMLSAVLKK